MDNKQNGLQLVLPFPDGHLSPNRSKSLHWAVRARYARDLKDACFYLTSQRGVELKKGVEYDVILLFCPPDRRTRDRDNLLAAYKAGLDGMCLALGIDDAQLHQIPEIGPVVEGGKVEITIAPRET